MNKITVPITTLSATLNLPYFSLLDSFCTKPMDVPATTASIPCPTEYINSNSIPQTIFPFPATIASRAINTGVEQGDEKIPPNIPATNAPMYPFFVFLLFR